MQRAYLSASARDAWPASAEQLVGLKLDGATKFVRAAARKPEESVVTKAENRCSNCGGKFGLVCYYHWGLRFCRKACKDKFLAKILPHRASGSLI